jgi:hypothetical protein
LEDEVACLGGAVESDRHRDGFFASPRAVMGGSQYVPDQSIRRRKLDGFVGKFHALDKIAEKDVRTCA